jgi:hypothetical protein
MLLSTENVSVADQRLRRNLSVTAQKRCQQTSRASGLPDAEPAGADVPDNVRLSRFSGLPFAPVTALLAGRSTG